MQVLLVVATTVKLEEVLDEREIETVGAVLFMVTDFSDVTPFRERVTRTVTVVLEPLVNPVTLTLALVVLDVEKVEYDPLPTLYSHLLQLLSVVAVIVADVAEVSE